MGYKVTIFFRIPLIILSLLIFNSCGLILNSMGLHKKYDISEFASQKEINPKLPPLNILFDLSSFNQVFKDNLCVYIDSTGNEKLIRILNLELTKKNLDLTLWGLKNYDAYKPPETSIGSFFNVYRPEATIRIKTDSSFTWLINKLFPFSANYTNLYYRTHFSLEGAQVSPFLSSLYAIKQNNIYDFSLIPHSSLVPLRLFQNKKLFMNEYFQSHWKVLKVGFSGSASYIIGNEIKNNLIEKKQSTPYGEIIIKIIDAKASGGASIIIWGLPSILTLTFINVIGYPMGQHNVKIKILAEIKNADGKQIAKYIGNGKATTFAALYWGYSLTGGGMIWLGSSVTKAAYAQAIKNAIVKIKQQIAKDSLKLREELLAKNYNKIKGKN